MEPTLMQGSKGTAVTDLQNLLNQKLTPSPRLNPDGNFGALTKAAVVRFQSNNWLVIDGIVGPCTWNALKGRETFVAKTTCNLVPQPTPTTCWAAAMAMTLGRSRPVSAPPGVDATNGMPNDSQLDDFPTTTYFNAYYGLKLLPPMSWLASGLAELINGHGRLLVDTLWNTQGYVQRQGSGGHYRVFAGMRGTNSDATVLIYDPWQPNQGAIYSVNYAKLLQQTPTTTYQISFR